MIQKIRFFIIRLLAGKTILVANIITDTIYISGANQHLYGLYVYSYAVAETLVRSKEHSIRGA